jgi:hypothetical protein
MRRSYRLVLAALVAIAAFVVGIVPIAWAINTTDWGVALMLLVPFIVYALMRLARALEEWVNQDEWG